MSIFGQPKNVTQKVILKYYTMMLPETFRLLDNISDLPTFKSLVSAFENYDFYDDPMIDTLYPVINEDSFIIQLIGSKVAQRYFDIEYYQDLRYKPATQNIINLATDLANQLKTRFPGTIWFKGHIVCLHPHGRQSLHIDQPHWQKHAHRIAVPIITSPDAVTYVEDGELRVPAGQLYELNVLRRHGSANEGKNIRVNLFLDYIPLKSWKGIEDFYNSVTRRSTGHPTVAKGYRGTRKPQAIQNT